MAALNTEFIGITIELKTARTAEVLAALDNAIKRALLTIGEDAIAYAQQVIIAEGRVDTGLMMNSIDARTGDDFVAIGTNVEYAPYQELGTSRGIKPARFLTRAVRDHKEEYMGIIQESLENA